MQFRYLKKVCNEALSLTFMVSRNALFSISIFYIVSVGNGFLMKKVRFPEVLVYSFDSVPIKNLQNAQCVFKY